MLRKLLIFVLVILPTSLFLTGCESAADVVQQAKDLQASATTQIEEVKTGIENVIAEVENAKESLLEKKRQLDQAITDIQDAMDSIDQLLNRDEVDEAKEPEIPATTAVELLTQKAELEASLTEIDAALTTVAETLEETPAEEVVAEPTLDTPEEIPTETAAEPAE